MAFGPSRPSKDSTSFGEGNPNDSRVAGYAPEEDVESFEGTDRKVFVSEYPFQSGTVAFLSLTVFLDSVGNADVETFVAGSNTRLIQYGNTTSPDSRGWAYDHDPQIDASVRISEDGGVSWGEYPIDTPQSSDRTRAIQFQRSSDQPEVNSASLDPGTNWSDTLTLPPSVVKTRDPVWVTTAVLDTNTGAVLEEWSAPFIVRGIHGPKEVAVQYREGTSGDWVNTYEPGIHTQVRFSTDQGGSWTSAFDFGSGHLKFQRSLSPPSYDRNNTNPGSEWKDTPDTQNIPLWVIRKETNGMTDKEWFSPVQVVPSDGPWSTTSVEDVTQGFDDFNVVQGKREFETKADFRTLPQPNQDLRIYWKADSDLIDYSIIGGHTYDRDKKPEFEGELLIKGQDLALRLEGDEDVQSYKVASNIGGNTFPDSKTGAYFEGRTFFGGQTINLGIIERGQSAFVTVTPYSDKEETKGGGDPQDPGSEKTFAIRREENEYVLQGRYAATNPEGVLTRSPSGGDDYFQLSRGGGVRWSKSKSTTGFTRDEITENIYFQRAIGAPEIDVYGATPGTGWQDKPPAGSITMWVTRGPVDGNGDLLSWARWTTPVIVVPEVSGRTLPPDKAIGQFSDNDSGPWSDTYSVGNQYVRVSWDEGNNWEVALMDTPTSNPTRPDGSVIRENVVNRFQRSTSEPSVDNGNFNPGVNWEDFPPTSSNDPLWMISGLADLDKDEMIDDWSDPIRIIKSSEAGGLIEFSDPTERPWEPIYKDRHTRFHISRNNGGQWAETRPLSEAYFKESVTEPASTTDPSTDGWNDFPSQGPPDEEVPLWVVLTDGSGGWTDPERVRQDTDPHGPKRQDVFIQYSSDKISWHDDIRPNDKWLRQRIGDGFWTAPIRIKGEKGEGQYRNFIFQANDSIDQGPEINANVPDWNSTATYNTGDLVEHPDAGSTYDYWECLNDGVTSEPPSSDWKNRFENSLDADSNWVDGPQGALDNGGTGDVYVWSINAQFESDPSSTTDNRISNWDGPFRFNGAVEDFFIRPTNGRSIKNSDPNTDLPLEVVTALGAEIVVLTDADDGPELYWKDPNVNYSNVTRDYDLIDTITGISSTRAPTFGTDQIDGNLTLYLRDGNQDTDAQYDTITLFDELDGVSGGYVGTPNGFVMTHYAGRDIDIVTPSPMEFMGTFVDAEGTTHKKDVTFSGVENANDNLEISWTVGGTQNDSAITADVRESGTSVSSPVVNPGELTVEFTGTDPQTGKETKFVEQLQTRIDTGVYGIRPLDGLATEEGSNGTLEFEVWRSDGEGTRQVSLSSGGFKLVLRPGTDNVVFTGSPVTISESDLVDPPNVLQLQNGDGVALDSVSVRVDAVGVAPPGIKNLDIERVLNPSTLNDGKITFDVDDPSGNVTAVKARRVSGGNFDSQTFDTAANLSWFTNTTGDTYEAIVPLALKHDSFIEVQLATSSEKYNFLFPFDEDKNPEVVNPNIWIDEDNVVSVSFGFDDDTDQMKLEWRKRDKFGISGWGDAKDSPFNNPQADEEITRSSNLIPVRLKEPNDWAEIRYTPIGPSGDEGFPLVKRFVRDEDNESIRGNVTKVTGSNLQAFSGRVLHLLYRPLNIDEVGNFEYRVAVGDGLGNQSWTSSSEYSTGLSDIDAGTDVLYVEGSYDQTNIWEAGDVIEYVNSPDAQTFTVQNVGLINNPSVFIGTTITVQEDIPSGMDTTGDLEADFFAINIGTTKETPSTVEVRVSFANGGVGKEKINFGLINESENTAKNNLASRTDLKDGQVVSAAGLDSKDDGLGGVFYYDENSSDVTDGVNTLGLNSLSGRLKRMSSAAETGQVSSFRGGGIPADAAVFSTRFTKNITVNKVTIFAETPPANNHDFRVKVNGSVVETVTMSAGSGMVSDTFTYSPNSLRVLSDTTADTDLSDVTVVFEAIQK